MRLEVRCCCVPKKLLGWLEVADYRVREGNTIQFILPPIYERIFIDGRRYETMTAACYVRLPIARIGMTDLFTGEPASHLALKSEETPLETLRQIPGFVEAPE